MIQGLMEWLPISSSGQSVLAMVNFLGIPAPESLSIALFLHLGSLLAVVSYFRQDITGILQLGKSHPEDRALLHFLVISTLATAIVGVPVYAVLKGVFASMGGKINALVGLSLIVTGFILYISRETGKRRIGDSRFLDMFLVGIAQGIAVVPGISRSGIIIATLLIMRFQQGEALRISFLMAVPAILGANVLEVAGGGLSFTTPGILLVGVTSSFLFSFLGIRFLLEIARKLRFDYFCIFMGTVALVFGA